MKLKAFFLALVVISVVAYGGANYYIEAKVQDKLDELVRMASPFVEISYGKITSDLRGKLQIEKIDLNTAEGRELQIGSIELEGPGPGFLWDLTSGFKNGEPPSSLILKLNGASVPVGQGFSRNFGPVTIGGRSEGSGQPEPCTLGGLLMHSGLEQVGMETLVANSVMGYHFDKSNGKAGVFLDYELMEMESMSLAMSLQGIPEPGAVVMGAMPLLTDADLSYSLQPGHIKRMVKHCAQQAQQSEQQFIETIFAQSDNQIARNLGFAPGPGIKQMLQTVVSNGGTVQLTASPGDNLDPATLITYKAEEIISLLNIELSLDDKPVKDLSIEFVTDGARLSGLRGLGLSSQDSLDDTKQDEYEDEDIEVRPEHRKLRYIETGIQDLHLYIGSRVKFYTRNSRQPKQGFLISYNGSTVSVEQNIHRGTMTAHIKVSELVKAEVLRRPPEVREQ